MDGYAKVSFTKFDLGNFGCLEGGPPGGGGLSSVPRGSRTYLRGGSRPLAGNPSRTTRKDWTEPVRL
jgi:hypothetical protein